MSSFDASSSLLGYLYQCRFALVESVRRLKLDPEFTVSIEHLDDVTFEAKGSGLELVQAKHHVDREADLSDYSSDLWKTLRVWATGLSDGSIPADATYFLVTTGRAEAASAAGKLGYAVQSRDVPAAKQRLDQVATTSRSVANAPAYKAYRELSDATRLNMLARMTVCDGRDRVEDLRAGLGRELGFPVERRLMPAYMDRVEGWWFDRVVHHVRLRTGPILSQELDEQIRTIRHQFGRENLPIDPDIRASAPSDADSFLHYPFVHQLRLIRIRDSRILQAILDYYRAREQRSRWIREDLLLVGELDDYERELTEAWRRYFDRRADEAGLPEAEEERIRFGREIFAWAEQLQQPIRRDVSSQFMTIGSLHMLADRRRVGWHPFFADRLRELLGGDP